ncbi:MAG: hypothetical protein M9894_27375 [Planctomycetes bacterium]|nr:hypothetical protein [Planctomycetota bacterium]
MIVRLVEEGRVDILETDDGEILLEAESLARALHEEELERCNQRTKPRRHRRDAGRDESEDTDESEEGDFDEDCEDSADDSDEDCEDSADDSDEDCEDSADDSDEDED